MDEEKMSNFTWITDEIIDDIFDDMSSTKHELPISERVLLVDGVFGGLYIVTPFHDVRIFSKDCVKSSIKRLNYSDTPCFVIEWKGFNSMSLSVDDIKSIFNDTSIRMLSFSRFDIRGISSTYYKYRDRIYRPNIDFTDITNLTIYIELTPHLMKGG